MRLNLGETSSYSVTYSVISLLIIAFDENGKLKSA